MSEFTYTFTTEQLSRGLRPSKRTARNTNYLYVSRGAVGRDGTLQTLDEIVKMASDEITDGFPYPQLFVFKQHIYLCGAATIYEYYYGALTEKITVMPGVGWSAVDFDDFMFFTNGISAVTVTGDEWHDVSGQYPMASAACNYNGQVLLGGIGAHTPPTPPPVPKIEFKCHFDDEFLKGVVTVSQNIYMEASTTTIVGTDQGPEADKFADKNPSAAAELDVATVSAPVEKDLEGVVEASYTYSVHA